MALETVKKHVTGTITRTVSCFCCMDFPIHTRETNAYTCTFIIFTNSSPLILRQGPGSEVLILNFEVVNCSKSVYVSSCYTSLIDSYILINVCVDYDLWSFGNMDMLWRTTSKAPKFTPGSVKPSCKVIEENGGRSQRKSILPVFMWHCDISKIRKNLSMFSMELRPSKNRTE